MLWKATEEEEEGVVPREHLNKHARQEERVALMQELDHHHDTIKSLLNLHLPPTDPRFRPVQTILNGLPSDWQAEVLLLLLLMHIHLHLPLPPSPHLPLPLSPLPPFLLIPTFSSPSPFSLSSSPS